MDKKQFVFECPKCLSKDKIIKRCVSCSELTCSSCSIQGECIECFTVNHKTEEIGIYFELKELET